MVLLGQFTDGRMNVDTAFLSAMPSAAIFQFVLLAQQRTFGFGEDRDGETQSVLPRAARVSPRVALIVMVGECERTSASWQAAAGINARGLANDLSADFAGRMVVLDTKVRGAA
ncbi:unnamed protein product [Closterium sp. Naga37s-1]|nr:unnamed protein product [Closterium sp. Naga37s-1]